MSTLRGASVRCARTEGKPLDRFPATRTADVDEMREAIAKTYGENRLALQRGAGQFHAYSNHHSLRSVALSYVTYGASVVQEFKMLNAFAQQFRIRGSSEIVDARAPVQLTADQSLVSSPGPGLKIAHSSGLEQYGLRIDRDVMLAKLAALTGEQPRHDLKFEPVADLRTPGSAYLRQLFMFLVDQLDSSEGGVPPLALAELEQAIIVAFLSANRHDESRLLDREPDGAAPWQIRRAEDYIEAHWDQPITIEALAVATGASARSLFHFFKTNRGYSPMAFVKQIRLRQARRMLINPNEKTSVTSVGFDCGFTNLGHFAKEYGKCFGELPSETLNRAKGRPRDLREGRGKL